MNIVEIYKERYSTKSFNANKKISNADFNKLEQALILSPSSTNIQPWHFIISNTTEGKERIIKATQGDYKSNLEKIVNSSHVVVFCSKTNVSDEHLSKILEKEDLDGRFSENSDLKNISHGARVRFSNLHKDTFNDLQSWLENQVYLNLGSFLVATASLKIDAVPIEGFDVSIMDKEFSLKEQGLKPLAIVALGYKKDDDFNFKLPKSRLNKADVITKI